MPKFDPSLLRNDPEPDILPEAPPPVGIFIPSSYNLAIFDFITNGTGSAVIDAVSGSGKTTTAIQCLKYIPPSDSVAFFAFNTAIAAELTSRIAALNLPQKIHASTFHSAGFAACRWKFGPLRVEGSKLRDLCRRFMSRDERELYDAFAIKLCSLAKNEGVGALIEDTEVIWQALFEHHDLVLDDKAATVEEGVKWARFLLGKSNEVVEFEKLIDFDDQLYLVSRYNLPVDTYKWVLIDETQDTNRVRRDLAQRSLAIGGRLLAIGDKSQAIYGWTGASHDAIEQVRETFHATTLPLSVNYRCSLAVLRRARMLVPHIEARDDAPEGLVDNVKEADLATLLHPADAILCRNNAPLIPLAYDLISKGIGVTVLGRDIGKGLTDLIKHLHPIDLVDLIAKLRGYKAHEAARYTRLEQPQKAEQVIDKVDCILAVIASQESGADLEDLPDAIDSMFSEGLANTLTLSTIHKAKGKEWPQVALFRPDLLPAKWAKQDWQLKQERNLEYVAYTRAKVNLFIVEPGH